MTDKSALEQTAVINKIIPFSCVDGPGNRMAIFFQGCQFRCTYCHNPETINLCTQCGICVAHCPSQALSLHKETLTYNAELCTHCDTCLAACPYSSTPKAEVYTVEKLFLKIQEAAPFISGISCSGGEATLYADFLTSLFRKIHCETELTCFVDTNGYEDLSQKEDFVNETDAFMLDVKAWDDNEHIQLTGKSNKTVIQNLNYLLSQNKLSEVRTVASKEVNYSETEWAVKAILQDRCVFKLLPCH